MPTQRKLPTPLCHLIIEIVRGLIRPLILSVRLAANIIAGHMLISLVSSPLIPASAFIFGSFFFTVIAHVVLGLAVSVAQSYGFDTLLSSCGIEINSPIFKFSISTISYFTNNTD